MVTHYDVLGVDDDADLEEIKRAYYGRARLYHPDAHASSPAAVRAEAERTMQSLNQAWSVLRDDAVRRRYDRRLAEQAREPVAAGARRWGGAGTTTPRASTPRTMPARRGAIGSGFQYWFGGASVLRPGGRSGGLNLRVTGRSLDGLRSLLPDGLSGLHAEHSPIGDADLRNLVGMTSLRYLDLTGTRVTDAGLVHLLGCRDLETLVLWDTAVTDDALALLARFPNLCHLGLGNTRVSDSGLRHLGSLRRLRLLQLSGTAVEGPGLRHLHGLPELVTVALPWKVRGRHRRSLRNALPRAAQVI